MCYGPDNTKELISNQIGWVKVPCGFRAQFRFSSDAHFENAICIYPQNSDRKLVERGNYNRSLNDWATPENNTAQDEWYRVTGWHKSSPPSASKPWIMSAIRNESNANQYIFGFEDAGGEEYDDMRCYVDIVQ
ncbi:hypothetical protein [Bacillus sp. NSP9.1]|uniref:hypothetical protein n=1 Tax=Bacillus sp. NSP9.1 TaxID=1071078 RepID=UPI00047C6F2D|nr:hypothetical protein [Bacillus sp. NSP9.1]QHZ46484.1 hypothetical protein M654_009335 [Bacillus sp. NSP9.1]